MKKLAEKIGTEELLVVVGMNQPSILRIMARTFHDGDPSYAGPLAGIALGLNTYHIFELKNMIPAEVWESEMGMYELEIEDKAREEIFQIMTEARRS